MVLDHLSAHKPPTILHWAACHYLTLCFTPTGAAWASPIEAHYGGLRQFTLTNSNHSNPAVQTRRLNESCADATPAPAMQGSLKQHAQNAPVSTAKSTTAAGGATAPWRHETLPTSPVTALAVSKDTGPEETGAGQDTRGT